MHNTMIAHQAHSSWQRDARALGSREVCALDAVYVPTSVRRGSVNLRTIRSDHPRCGGIVLVCGPPDVLVVGVAVLEENAVGRQTGPGRRLFRRNARWVG